MTAENKQNPSSAVARSILATDGRVLTARVYESPAAPRFDVLMLPGVGVPQRVFRHFGAWLAEQGARAVSIDYRGIADSRGAAPTGHDASLRIWAERDAVGALRYVEASGGGRPVFLLGHSFGGQALGFSDEFRRLKGALLIGSQLAPTQHWDGFERFKVCLYWNVILPIASAFFSYVPGWTGIGEPIPAGVAREWARWGRSREWLLSHVPEASARYAAFDRPLRAYAMLDDQLAPPRAVADLLSRFDSAPVERIDLDPRQLGVARLGHVGPLRPAQAGLWPEMLAFFERHLLAPRHGGCIVTS
jgi:predicted alpha/beta hydrolase